MTFRSRPVLDRKHRPRWQDELRTQQLTILGFAIAIALAIGIFGAAAWNGYWESHFRPIAVIAGQSIERSELIEREQILTAEAIATVTELQAQLGGPRDQLIQQQIDSISAQFNQLSSFATDSLVESTILRTRAGDFGISVSGEEVDAAVAERMRLPERIRARVIVIDPLELGEDENEENGEDENAEGENGEDEPTDKQRAAARAEAEAARARVEGGEDFATVAGDVSHDPTAMLGGMLGWIGADDPSYAEYFELLADAEDGDLVGPVESDDRYVLLELISRRAATEGELRDLLRERGVSDGAYRAYVRDDLLHQAFQDHFLAEVVGEEPEQRRVARIVINPTAAEAVPQERARHILVQPDPDAQDQSEASDEEWEAAREEADEVRELVAAEDADWFEIASERSDDLGSGARGGDLGWYDPEESPFVDEFADALAELEIGEISEPVRSDFGWHIIQKTGQRESPDAFAAELVAQLRDDPDAFAEIARRLSEDHATAREDGEVGWVARYELDVMAEQAIFGLETVGEVSEPREDASGRISIYQLLEESDGREIEPDRLAAFRASGFERWLSNEVRAPVETWIDPQFATTTAGR
jgi:parvulin-like peptidyl-prolyl isomerase